MNMHPDQIDPVALQRQGLYVLQVLDRTGDLTLTWDPNDPAQVANAREEVQRLKAAGYTFFAVVGASGEDEVDAGQGTLIVRRITDPLAAPEADELPPEPGEEPAIDPEPLPVLCTGKSKTGKACRRKAGKDGRCWQHPLEGKAPRSGPKPKPSPKPGRRSVAMRPMAGG
jgi:hypothetical protein